MTEPTAEPRTTTAVDAVADAYFDAAIVASPIEATYLGVPGRDTELDDLSPDGFAHHAHLARRTLAATSASALGGVEPADAVDRVTVAAMRERLGLVIETHDAGYDAMALNVIASPLQACRDVFDLMPTGTQEHWATIAARLSAVPQALEQYTQTLLDSADRGLVTPRRQGASADGAPLADSVRADLDRGARAAAQAYEQIGTALRERLLGLAPTSDAAGRERYGLASRSFLGGD